MVPECNSATYGVGRLTRNLLISLYICQRQRLGARQERADFLHLGGKPWRAIGRRTLELLK